MSATPERVKIDGRYVNGTDDPERRGDPLNEVGGHPDPEADPWSPDYDPDVEPEPDVSADESTPPPDSEPEGDSASVDDDAPIDDDDPLFSDENDAVPNTDPTEYELFTREIPGAAGHGPARAYGYIALATALGATAELTSGGTRSTSAHPLVVTVQADVETFMQLNDIYDEIVPVAEQTAAVRRGEIRKAAPAVPSYDLSLATRAVLAGFPQGAASALVEPGTTRPAPFAQATRARRIDGDAHRSAVASGRNWARHHLPAARDRQSA